MSQKDSHAALFKRRRDHSKGTRSKSKTQKFSQYMTTGAPADANNSRAVQITVPQSTISDKSGRILNPPTINGVVHENNSFLNSKKKIKIKLIDKN
jgi:hypothetical protein